MAVYSLPAFIALVFKLVLLVYALQSRVKNEKTRLFLFLLIALSLHNFSEVFLLNYFPRYGVDATLLAAGYAYFATLIPFIAILLHLSLRFALESKSTSTLPYVLLYVPAAVLECLLLFTDYLVVGFQPFQSFTIIRVPGSFYFLFETYFTLYLAVALVNLVVAARDVRLATIARTRNRLWLAGLAPMALLMIYIVVSRHMSWPQLPSTFYVPIAQAFFLLVATYATHQYRLFDIEFYIPGSRVRERKTVFYQRIQATVAELADLHSVDEALSRVANILRCPVALVGGWRPVLAHAGEGSMEIAQFPNEPLAQINRIVVANEIEQAMPQLHRTMKQFRVGAIVPFYPHSKTAASFLLLGDSFGESVYTPLDFRKVERLFDSLAEFFLDRIAFLRTELAQSNDLIQQQQEELARIREENILLRDSNFRLMRENHAVRKTLESRSSDKPASVLKIAPKRSADWSRPLSTRMEEEERKLIVEALNCGNGNKSEAARLLGVSPSTLHYKLERFGLTKDKKDTKNDENKE